MKRVVRELHRRKVGALGVAILLVVIAGSVFAPVIAVYSPAKQDLSNILRGPSREHILGTDELGRDILSRVVYGSRVSLQVGVVAVGAALVIGTPIGLVSGFYGGRVDSIVMRFMDGMMAFPALVLALAICAALGSGLRNAMIAITLTYLPVFARVARGQTMVVMKREFIDAARALGASNLRIVTRHVFPNILAPIIVQASLSVSGAILSEASLSFLGMGVQPPQPAWGSMLRSGYPYLEVSIWPAVWPGLAIFFTVLGFNLVGDMIRDIIDPRLRLGD